MGQRTLVDRSQLLLEDGVEIALIGGTGAHLGLKIHLFGEESQSKSITLADKEFCKNSGRINSKGELVGMGELALAFKGEEHA